MVGLVCSGISLIILLIFVFLRLYGTSDDIQYNKGQLERFSVLQECGDEYTYVNTEQIDADLTLAN